MNSISLIPVENITCEGGRWKSEGLRSLIEIKQQAEEKAFAKGWYELEFNIDSEPLGMMPSLWYWDNNKKNKIDLGFIEGSYKGFFSLPNDSQQLYMNPAPWMAEFSINRFTINQIPGFYFAIKNYFSFLRYIFNPEIFERIIYIFFLSREGFMNNARFVIRIFMKSGLSGLRKNLQAFTYNESSQDSIPHKYWYLNYQRHNDFYGKLADEVKDIDLYVFDAEKFAGQNKRPAGSMNEAEYLVLLAKDARPEPLALARIAQAALACQSDLIYSDEIITTEGDDWELITRPAFSMDYFLQFPRLGSIVAVEKSVYQKSFPHDNPAHPDPDVLCALLENCTRITHIPDILCLAPALPVLDDELMYIGVKSYLENKKINASITGHDKDAGNTIRYRIKDKWKATIIIPTKNNVGLLKKCIASVENTCAHDQYDLLVVDNESDDAETLDYLNTLKTKSYTVYTYNQPFNYSKINNVAVKQSPQENKFLVLLNDDVQIISDDWLPRMVENANRDEVGIVGALMVYTDNRVQHAGIVIGFRGIANHIMKFEKAYLDEANTIRNPGYGNNLIAIRDYSAVTGACMVMRRAVFDQLGGFNEKLQVIYNDVDLSLRARQAGYKVLYDGHIMMIHHESHTRKKNKKYFHNVADNALFGNLYKLEPGSTDPWFSPLLSKQHFKHEPANGLAAGYDLDFRTIKLDSTD